MDEQTKERVSHLKDMIKTMMKDDSELAEFIKVISTASIVIILLPSLQFVSL